MKTIFIALFCFIVSQFALANEMPKENILVNILHDFYEHHTNENLLLEVIDIQTNNEEIKVKNKILNTPFNLKYSTLIIHLPCNP